jgi:hypothetical protein
MTSMLHDADRNSVYERAISAIIGDFQKTHGRPPTVLDIGEIISQQCVSVCLCVDGFSVCVCVCMYVFVTA